MWLSSNWNEIEYAEYLPAEFMDLWDDKALEWLKQFYHDNKTQEIIKEYVILNTKLNDLPRGIERSELCNKIYKLEENSVNLI